MKITCFEWKISIYVHKFMYWSAFPLINVRPIRFRFNKQDRIKNFSALKQSFEGIHDLPGSQVQSTMAWRN